MTNFWSGCRRCGVDFTRSTPADRARLLADRLAVLEPGGPAARRAQAIRDPESFAAATAADRAGRTAIARLLPEFVMREPAKQRRACAYDSHQRSAWGNHLGRSLAAGSGGERLSAVRKRNVPRRRSINCTAPVHARAAAEETTWPVGGGRKPHRRRHGNGLMK